MLLEVVGHVCTVNSCVVCMQNFTLDCRMLATCCTPAQPPGPSCLIHHNLFAYINSTANPTQFHTAVHCLPHKFDSQDMQCMPAPQQPRQPLCPVPVTSDVQCKHCISPTTTTDPFHIVSRSPWASCTYGLAPLSTLHVPNAQT